MATEAPGTFIGRASRELVELMGEATVDFLASLGPDQKAKATFPFGEDGERVKWYYTPVDRGGLPLFEMDRRQQRLAHQLVSTGLSRSGYVAASTIMGLEATLDALEGWRWEGRGRDPALYYVSVFGRPDAQTSWGWRFEGHHISLNYTIAGGRIVSPTPTFFGANPAEAPLSRVGVLRPLSGVEDLARELVTSLHEEQWQQAVVSAKAPSDILTSNRSHADEVLEPKGLPGAGMDARQQEVIAALIGEYIHRMPDEIAELEAARLVGRGVQDLHFAWAGGIERGEGHYYRIQGPRFLVEYDNTQNDANHIHSVWRDPADDFGALLLAQHYARDHDK
jgi:hypothetical protein